MQSYRIIGILLTLVGILTTATFEASAETIAAVDLKQGTVQINYPISADTPIKVMVTLGDQSYTYDLLKPKEFFPLQFGDGTYTVSLYQRVQGTQYRLLNQSKLTVDLADEFVPFLGSSQVLNWNAEMLPITSAKSMTLKEKIEAAKVQQVYS